MNSELLAQVVVNGLLLGLLYTLLALGLTLLFSVLRVINFAHGELYMLGAVGLWLLSVQGGLNYYEALALSAGGVALVGILMERLFLRPFRGNLEGSLIISLGLVLILQASVHLALGDQPKVVHPPLGGRLEVLGATLAGERLWVMALSALLVGGLYLFISFSRAGRAMRAVAQDSEAAALQGIDVGQMSMLAMGIGSGLAAVAGAAWGTLFAITPYMGTLPLLKAFVIVVLGGLGSIPGVAVGGLLIGMSESFITTYLGADEAALAAFAILILVLLVRPTGLLGHQG